MAPKRDGSAGNRIALLVGLPDDALNDVRTLLDSGRVVVIAPTYEAARTWMEAEAPFPWSNEFGGPNDGDEVVIRVADLQVNLREWMAYWQNRPLNLTTLELRLLAVLASDVDRAWTYEELTSRVWRRAYFGDSTPLRAASKRLRRKLQAYGVEVGLEAVRGVGFRLRAPRGSRDVPSGR